MLRLIALKFLQITFGTLLFVSAANSAVVTFSIEGAGSGSSCGAGGCTLSGDFTFDDVGSPGFRNATDASFNVLGEFINESIDISSMFVTTVITDSSGSPDIVSFSGSIASGIFNVCLASDASSVCGPAFNTWSVQEPFGGPILASGAAGLAVVPLPASIWFMGAALVGLIGRKKLAS